jgi:hypothetical protein
MPSTGLTITARYENIPGASKNGPKIAKSQTGLWFDPLTFAPMSPHADETTDRVGISKGASQTVAKFNTPLHADGDEAGAGTGGITAQLKYAADAEHSFTVKVHGKFPKGSGDVTKLVQQYVAEKIAHRGDLDELQAEALTFLTTRFPDATNVTVELKPVETGKHASADAGKTHIFYKARQNPVIDLNVPVVNVADRTITSGGATTKVEGQETNDEKHNNVDTNKVEVKDKKTETSSSSSTATQTSDEEWHRANKRTFDEVITQIESSISTVASNLVTKLEQKGDFSAKGDWVEDSHRVKITDYTKGVKGGTESGEKDKKNWAAWIEDGLKGLDKAIELPFLKGNKWVRKLNEWGLALDLAEQAAGALAVRGKVHYTDSHEDTKVHEKDTDDTHASGKSHQSGNYKDTATLTRDLNEVFTKAVTSVKTTHSTDVSTDDVTKKTKATQTSDSKSDKTSTDDYGYDSTKKNEGGSSTVKKNQSVTTHLEYSTTVKETTTKPVLEANIVDGDGEVSGSPFPAPGAKKA